MPAESEAGLLEAIRELAHYTGWMSYHPYRSTRSERGWVDLVRARPFHPLWLLELQSAHGRVTPEQAQWLEVLSSCTGAPTALWRPADWATIARVWRTGT
jgi:hypothetical protein